MFNHYTRLKDPTLNMCVQLIFLIQYALSDQGHNIQSYPICTTKIITIPTTHIKCDLQTNFEYTLTHLTYPTT